MQISGDEYRANRLFYEKNMSIPKIAEEMSVRQEQVKYWIKRARKMNMLTVTPPNIALVERHLLDTFKRLKDTKVVASPRERSSEVLNAVIGKAAADWFVDNISNGNCVAISGGTSVGSMIKNLKQGMIKKLDIFSLIGCGGELPAWAANTLVGLMCMSLSRGLSSGNVRGHILSIPGFLKGENFQEMKRQLLSLQDVKKHYEINEEGIDIVRIKEKIDIAFTGIGSPIQTQSTLSRIVKEIDEKFLTQLVLSGGVGHILYKIYDSRGKLLAHEFNQRIIGVSLDSLKEMCEKHKLVVAIAGGDAKIESIFTLLMAKTVYFNVLITDDITATKILDKDRFSKDSLTLKL
jgi:DNA-binding transcriptional regulator LsrR (DeoR family)